MLDQVLFLALGIFVGLVSTFFGAGGGVFIVPILPMIYDISIREVVPTSLLTVLGVVFINTLFFKKSGLINWRAGLGTGVTSAIFAFFISKVAHNFDTSFIYKTIAGILFTSAALLLFIPAKENYFRDRDENKSLIVSILVGIGAGFAQGLTGIGAGLLITPIFLVFNVVPYSQVVPTSNLCMIFSSLFAISGYMTEVKQFAWPYMGPARMDIALMILLGTFITAPLGRKYQHSMPENVRRIILSIILIGLGVHVIIKNI